MHRREEVLFPFDDAKVEIKKRVKRRFRICVFFAYFMRINSF